MQALPLHGTMIGILAATLVATGAVIGYLIWERTRLQRRLAALMVQRENVESERLRLEAELASRENQEIRRFGHLEHDLRSALSVTIGFASILGEQMQQRSGEAQTALHKSVSAIQVSAKKTLQILDTAATTVPVSQDSKEYR
jgi:signal transduction histidine kinase